MSLREPLVYLDASALVKLVAAEPESAALRDFIADRPGRVSSALTRVELLRAVGRSALGRSGRRRAEEVLSRVAMVHVSSDILDAAGSLRPPELRSLDAIHLATALSLGAELEGMVVYDHRLIAAAAALDVRCWSPS